MSARLKNAQYRDIAFKLYGCDECEVPDDAAVSPGDDDGAWVAVWVWAPDPDSGSEGDES